MRTLRSRKDGKQCKHQKAPRRLRMVIGMKKRRAANSYFQAIRNKVGRDTSVVMLYDNGSFPPSPEDEDSVLTGSMKRHLLTRGAGEHRTSRGCLFCQKNDLCAWDGGWNSTSLDWRSSTACNLAGEAGRGEGTSTRVMQKDKLPAMNTRRGEIAEMKGKKRPYDFQNAESSVWTATASRGLSRVHNILPLYGPGATVR